MGRLCLVALLVLIIPAFVGLAYGANTVSYVAYYYDYYYECSYSYYYYCNDWYYYSYWYGWYYYRWYWYYGYYDWCYPYRYENCYNYYYQYSYIAYRCADGWTGTVPNCNTPVCNPTCTGGQVCSAPNTCTCITTNGPSCQHVACSYSVNCYPGTCVSGSCQCPLGFTGTNCQTLTFVPQLSSCGAQVFGTLAGSATEQVVASTTTCTDVTLPRQITWIATTNVAQLEVSWTAQDVNPITMPTGQQTSYITNAPVSLGVTVATFNVSFQGYTSSNVNCPAAANAAQNVPSTVTCSNIVGTWSNLNIPSTYVVHNATFNVTVKASVGGMKLLTATADSAQDFTGASESSLSMTFGFDIIPPVHCLSNSNNCTLFPIYLNETVTVNPVIQPSFNGWTDDASGIDRFHIEVYYMQPDSSNILSEVGGSISTVDIPDSLLSRNDFQFTLSKAGTYSIQLTVFDRANNSAKARKIVTYLGSGSLAVDSSAFYITAADADTGYKYITTLVPPQNEQPYQFTVTWVGGFVNSLNPTWGLEVNGWPYHANVIDDNYGTKFGLRSINAIDLSGIATLDLAYVIDKNGGIGVNVPDNFTKVNSTETQYTFSVDQSELTSGDTIVVWIRAYDLSANMYAAMTLAYVDTCKYCVNVTGASFQFHTVDEYTSSVDLTVVSRIGGIHSIDCDIYDSTKKIDIKQVVGTVATRQSTTQRKKRGLPTPPCAPNDVTCYCIPLGECYNVTQLINIDNCIIDQFAGDTLTLTYNVTSLTGNSISGSLQITPYASQIECRPIAGLTGGAIVGIVIGCIIGGIILILLIILLVMMCLRYSQHKHPVPPRIMILAASVKHRFQHEPGVSETHVNDLYESKSVYYKSGKNTGDKSSKNAFVADGDIYGPALENPNWKVSAKDVELGDVIAEGRFAVIRRAFLVQNNGRTEVAAKTLKRGYKNSDIGLLRLKILFLAKEIPHHPNIVKFIAAVDEDNNSAPILLMELCEGGLKDWLTSTASDSITVDVLENMLTFTLDIAHGMEYLHSIKITHRRLAARNVLLKQSSSGGLQAKLIGLDPSKDDGDETAGDEQGREAIVPIKWLAPETLATLNDRRPTYDVKTDAWSFGITVWEIYSQGQIPYPDKRSGDVRSLIQKGYRMSCPENCPPEMFNDVVSACWNAKPKKRPTFKSICALLESFRNGNSAAQTGYYAAGDSAAETGYYAAGVSADVATEYYTPGKAGVNLHHDNRASTTDPDNWPNQQKNRATAYPPKSGGLYTDAR